MNPIVQYVLWVVALVAVCGAIVGLVAVCVAGGETEGQFIQKTGEACPEGLSNMEWTIANDSSDDPERKLTKIQCKEKEE